MNPFERVEKRVNDAKTSAETLAACEEAGQLTSTFLHEYFTMLEDEIGDEEDLRISKKWLWDYTYLTRRCIRKARKLERRRR